MRFLLACDKFKGSLTSAEVNQALAQGLRECGAEVRCLAVSDGGQGFLQAVAQVERLELHEIPCHDALGRLRSGRIGWKTGERQAYLESADAIGLPWLTPEERNPWLASSEGLGELMESAQKSGAKQLWIGLGGSATCDGGIGCLGALGWSFQDAQGRALPAVPASLAQVRALIPPAKPFDPALKLICDVENPPLGAQGGVQVYSPQKGADAETMARLEAGMGHWLSVMESWTGRHDLASLRHGGAAGCLGLGLSQLLDGTLLAGADWMLDMLDFASALNWADCVITGEGAFDASSLQGKIPGLILQRSIAAGKRVHLVSGQKVVDCAWPHDALQARDARSQYSPQRSRQLLRAIGRERAQSMKLG